MDPAISWYEKGRRSDPSNGICSWAPAVWDQLGSHEVGERIQPVAVGPQDNGNSGHVMAGTELSISDQGQMSLWLVTGVRSHQNQVFTGGQ